MFNNNDFKQWPYWNFSKGSTHDFGQKMEILPYPSLDEIKSWSDSLDTLPPFWNIWATEKACTQITAESQMFDYKSSKVSF